MVSDGVERGRKVRPQAEWGGSFACSGFSLVAVILKLVGLVTCVITINSNSKNWVKY